MALAYARIGAIALPALIIAVTVVQSAVSPNLLYLDPLVAAEVSGNCCKTYFGIVSTLGVLLWIATAAVCLFGAYVLHQLGAGKSIVRFALIAGGFTVWLALDDAFLFHENIAPKFGIPQTLVLMIYVVFALAYTAFCASQIWAADKLLFVAAVGFLACSLLVDVILKSTDAMIVVLEDGSKFLGITCWFAFHVVALGSAVRETARLSQSRR